MRNIFLILLFLLSVDARSQDERFMRELFAGDLTKDFKEYKKKFYHYETFSKPWVIDLDKDNLPEYVIYEKRDGENFFTFLNPNKKVIKSFYLEASGKNPHLYRISMRMLSSNIRIFILSFYEGSVEYLKFNSVSRLHFITIRDNDLSTLHHYKGPPVWEEASNGFKHYHQREYPYALRDFNKDGIREVVVKSGPASWVYMFQGEKKGWAKI